MAKNIFRAVSKNMVLAVNLTVALVFTLSCHGRYLFMGGFWPLTLLPIAAPYLLLVLFLFFLLWMVFRSKWLLLFPCTLLLNIMPLQNLVPFRLSSTFNTNPPAKGFRIMSWNVAQFDVLEHKSNPGKKENMVGLINSYLPDIMCIQELVAGDAPVNLNTAYYKKYSFFTIGQFSRDFQTPHCFFSYNPKEDFLTQQHFGMAIFSKYPIIRSQKVTVDQGRYNDFFQYCDINTGSDTVRVFNVHLQSLKFNKANLRFIDNPSIDDSGDVGETQSIFRKFRKAVGKRKNQADRVRKEIERSPFPVIVCGDFNDVPNSYAYQVIGRGLQNGFSEKGAGLGRTFTKISPTLRIDNIFCSPTFEVNQFTQIERELSDHYPVVADLKLKKR